MKMKRELTEKEQGLLEDIDMYYFHLAQVRPAYLPIDIKKFWAVINNLYYTVEELKFVLQSDPHIGNSIYGLDDPASR